ncbi:acyl-coenzyme A diphosphatase FITM2 [Anthonomus grandis grandis]|uniref:acyl-coenzyme A diphosphatase FITM2 n=1 Tax=Anthonomus grandis grandis TaxID=2921223 RepID=UPI002165721B|nr:acyl-coenzyme A diphosphatase FITM2 [Anthonomus grandis grandis]
MMASKPSRRKPLHPTKMNFRPTTSDSNMEFKGTKPTSEPTSIKEIFMLMVLYVCKKSLFFDTNIKVGLYLLCLFAVSLVADVATIPRIYLSRSDNLFNKFFVKYSWGWNLLIILPFVIFTSYIYCCGQVKRILHHHLPRIAVATFFWYFWTNLFNYIEASFGRCQIKAHGSKETCLKAGYIWNGFDTSGHSFILIYGSLFLIEEARAMLNWDSIKEYIRLEEHSRNTKQTESTNPLRHLTPEEFKTLQFNYEKYTPYIRANFILITLFQILWDIMLFCTMLYYHVMIEKFLGGCIAILTWFFTYRVWFRHPSLLPKLPGEGVFKYIKTKVKEPQVTVRRRTGSIVNGSTGPMFMGRPIYTQNNPNPSQNDDGSGEK